MGVNDPISIVCGFHFSCDILPPGALLANTPATRPNVLGQTPWRSARLVLSAFQREDSDGDRDESPKIFFRLFGGWKSRNCSDAGMIGGIHELSHWQIDFDILDFPWFSIGYLGYDVFKQIQFPAYIVDTLANSNYNGLIVVHCGVMINLSRGSLASYFYCSRLLIDGLTIQNYSTRSV